MGQAHRVRGCVRRQPRHSVNIDPQARPLGSGLDISQPAFDHYRAGLARNHGRGHGMGPQHGRAKAEPRPEQDPDHNLQD